MSQVNQIVIQSFNISNQPIDTEYSFSTRLNNFDVLRHKEDEKSFEYKNGTIYFPKYLNLHISRTRKGKLSFDFERDEWNFQKYDNTNYHVRNGEALFIYFNEIDAKRECVLVKITLSNQKK